MSMFISDWCRKVKKFHDAVRVETRMTPGFPKFERTQLRHSLIKEEVSNELLNAILNDDIIEIADGCADGLVVIIGTCLEYGLPIEALFAEVMRANMSKLDGKGKPLYNAQGKVMKGPNYRPPDIAGVLRAYGWKDGREKDVETLPEQASTELDEK